MHMHKFKGIKRSLPSLVRVLSVAQVSISETKFMISLHINNKSFYLIMTWWLLPWCSCIGFQKRFFVWCILLFSMKLFNATNRKIWDQHYTLHIWSSYHHGNCVFRRKLLKNRWINYDLHIIRVVVFTGCEEHVGWMLKPGLYTSSSLALCRFNMSIFVFHRRWCLKVYICK